MICSEKQKVSENNSKKTVSFEEQITSKDKYSSIFSHQIAASVFFIFQIFFATRIVLFRKLGNITWTFPGFGWRIFRHVTRLGQSRARAKIYGGLKLEKNHENFTWKFSTHHFVEKKPETLISQSRT